MADRESVISSSEVAFPRGGASILTPLEVKEISNEATLDVLFEVANANKRAATDADETPAKKKRSKSKKSSKPADETEDVEIAIEHFHIKNMIPGVRVLGQIISIGKMDLTISIGDNLKGFIPITAISQEVQSQIEKYDDQQDSEIEDDDETETTGMKGVSSNNHKVEFPELSDLFQLGQWLRAKVVTADDPKRRKIQLSIEPALNNENMEKEDLLVGNTLQCSVKSIQDHGLIMNVGMDDFNGFISNKELKNSGDFDLSHLKIGSVILASIVSPPASRTISLRPAQAIQTSKKNPAASTLSSIDSIQPGNLVDALVASISKDGLAARVFGLVDASFSLPQVRHFNEDQLKGRYSIGNNMKARVIGVLLKAGTRKLLLSLAPHTLALKKAPSATEALDAFPMGHIFDAAEVMGVDLEYIYVSIGSSDFYGQVHRSKIDPKKDLAIDYTQGTKHRARVIGYLPMDDMLLLTFEPTVIASKFMSVSEIPDGQVVDSAEIVRVLPEQGGIVVKIFGSFEGIVTSNNISDIKLVYPERKFRVGSKVKARVLSTYGRTAYVTLKKSLVNAPADQVLASVDQAKPGMKCVGTVDKFVFNGALVSFFGGLRAFLPKSEISESFVKNASDHLRIGQTVDAKVLLVDQNEDRLTITLLQATQLSSAQSTEINDLVPGKSLVRASVVEKTKDATVIELEGSNLRGVINAGLLCDGNYEQNRAAAKKLPIGEFIEVLILEKDLRARAVLATAKHSLIDAVKKGNMPTTISELVVEDRMYHGYIKNVTNMGLFVLFGGKLTGLVLGKHATSNLKDDLTKKFYRYQSVTCRVVSIDEETNRFLLSLKSANHSTSTALVNPIDKSKKFFGDFTSGTMVKGEIKAINDEYLLVKLADNFDARVAASQCFDSFSEIKNPLKPLEQFKLGTKVTAKVIGFHDVKLRRITPFVEGGEMGEHVVLELTLLKLELERAGTPIELSRPSQMAEGSKVTVFVQRVSRGNVVVNVAPSVYGRIHYNELTGDVDLMDDFEKNFPVGSALQATVAGVDLDRDEVILKGHDSEISTFFDIEVGSKYPARVLKVRPGFVLVELAEGVAASACPTDALNDYSQSLEEVLPVNSIVSATVLMKDDSNKKIAVSLRTADAVDPTINSVADLKRGQVVRGFVKNITNGGVFVALGRTTFALAKVADLSDHPSRDWKKDFTQYQLVEGKILACEQEGRVLMTLKESQVKGDLEFPKTFADLKVGDVYEGTVASVTDFGAFVKLDGTENVSGLCHRSQIADNEVKDVSALFGVGDRVKVKVLSINAAKRQMSLGMKASYFAEGDVDEDMLESEDDNENNSEMEQDGSSADAFEDEENVDEMMEDAFDEDSLDESDAEAGPVASMPNGKGGLSTNGFDWTASILDQVDDDDSSSDEEDFTHEKKKSKKKKVQRVEDKTGDLNSRAPQSVSDFERLLVGNPNSSIMWMNYMSFQLQLSEIERAREIGERALKTISYREEQEKLNIWIALLNLENTFGSEELLEEVFKRACQYMDSFLMHQKLVGIYTMSEKFDEADELFNAMCKKFSKIVAVWVQYGTFLLLRGLLQETHQVLARALKALSKKDHVEVVRKFAQMEFANGDAEQGRSLFEGLIADAPKRIDIWNVYIDQEMKQLEKSKAEDLFQRVLERKLSRKQAKFFFNKWLAFEEEQGDELMCARVKAKATEYVKAATNVE